MSSLTRQSGLTLLEMLVALAITALVAALAYGSLSSARVAKESIDEALGTVNSLETAFQLLATDLHHVLDRELPGAAAGLGSVSPTPTFMGGEVSRGAANILLGDYVLRFVRDGWANPLQQQRSDLQRVGYRWIDGQLWRDYWPERNQPVDAPPAGTRLLLEDLQELQIRFLPPTAGELREGAWLDYWPPESSDMGTGVVTLPLAVELTLTLEDVGDVRRIFSLPGI